MDVVFKEIRFILRSAKGQACVVGQISDEFQADNVWYVISYLNLTNYFSH